MATHHRATERHLPYGITQSVQNATARLMSGARRYEHITPVLQELHWLPVRRQVDF